MIQATSSMTREAARTPRSDCWTRTVQLWSSYTFEESLLRKQHLLYKSSLPKLTEESSWWTIPLR